MPPSVHPSKRPITQKHAHDIAPTLHGTLTRHHCLVGSEVAVAGGDLEVGGLHVGCVELGWDGIAEVAQVVEAGLVHEQTGQHTASIGGVRELCFISGKGMGGRP